MKRTTFPLSQRIAGKHAVDERTGCWIWTGHKNRNGYGLFVVEKAGPRRAVLAHRAPYEVHVGPIPEGALICHRCDRRDCINPAHLHPGTPQSNMDDKARRGRGFWPGPAPKNVSGEANGRAKLTAEQVAAIRSSREPAGLLAAAFEVTPVTIYQIRGRRTWRNL